MKEELIDLFGLVPKADASTETVDFATLNKKAVRRGYLIHPDCCTRTLERWLDTRTINYNATFYREWTDILCQDRFSLFVDQLLHYASTYGTDFQDYAWTPNEGSLNPDFTHLKVIRAGTEQDFIDAAMKLISAGIALKPATITTVCDFIIETAKDGRHDIDLSGVRCREAQAYLAFKLKKFPKDEFGILRCLMYAFTGKCALIKDGLTIQTIKNRCKFDYWGKEARNLLPSLTEDNLKALSRIYRRYKPLFLAMKCKETARVINRLNKLAVRNHTPLRIGFWQNVISTPHTEEEITKALESLDNFGKVRILQAINVAFLDEDAKVYVIRNGNSYVRHDYTPDYDFGYLETLRRLVRKPLVDSLAKKACRVRYPKDFELTVPSSQKSFIGNMPFGTSFRLTENNVIGIYWRNEWGTHDFDLSMTSYDGRRIGWNADFRNGDDSVVFSGDMTDADPEATELLFVRDVCPDGIIRVNRYWGEQHSSFRFFTANEAKPMGNLYGHMVDPDNIRLDTMVEVDTHGEKTVGLVHDNTLTLMDVYSGNGRVSCSRRHTLEFIKAMANRTRAFLRLRDLLGEAGFVEDDADPEIDFTEPNVNTIIDLLAA